MPRIPKYRHHKATNQVLIELNGKRFYLGKFNSPESKELYERGYLLEYHTRRGIRMENAIN